MDPIDQITPPLQPGQRVVVRHRLPDSSATDAIGVLESVDSAELTLRLRTAERFTITRPRIIAAKRVPLVSRGRDPLREDPGRLERLAVPAWADQVEPLGEWLLRSGGGFTGRANSCLAVGDPGLPIAAAAGAVVEFAERHGIPALVQVIDSSAEEAALRELGWLDSYLATDVLVQRLVALVGAQPEVPAEVIVGAALSDDWLAAYRLSRPGDVAEETLRRILSGPGSAFGSIAVEGRIAAIGKGHVNEDWLGLASLWTHPGHRRQRWMSKIITGLGAWAAGLGARSVYLQVAAENKVAHAAYARLGFAYHHRYRYLAPGQPAANQLLGSLPQCTRSVGS